MAATMKNVVFWDVSLCGSCGNPSFGGTYRLYRQDDNNQLDKNNVEKN
jgi:hypothetical protein